MDIPSPTDDHRLGHLSGALAIAQMVAEKKSADPLESVMTLGQKQEHFARLIMLLMLHLHSLGYSMRGGHWLRCQNCRIGKNNSLHKQKLAFDINLTLSPSPDERPRLLTGTAAQKAHTILHNYFDTIGGSKRIPHDLNHYSLEHNDMR